MLFHIKAKTLLPEDAPFLVFLFNLTNATIWVAYGLHDDGPIESFYGNIGGVFLSIFLFIVFAFFKHQDNKKKASFYIILLLIWDGILFAVLLTYFAGQNANITGGMGVTMAVIMYSGPITLIYKACKESKHNSIPLFVNSISVINGLLWLLFAIGEEDVNIIIPNVFGILFGTIGVATNLIIKRKQPEKEAAEEIPVIETIKMTTNPETARENKQDV